MSEATFTVSLEPVGQREAILRLSFGRPASTDEIVRDIAQAVSKLDLGSGFDAVWVNGPAPVAGSYVLAHVLAHVAGTVGVFDPKVGGYIVAISHGGLPVGQVVPGPQQ